MDRERDYKKQLAEKDKEIGMLKHKIIVEEPCLIRNYKDMIEQLKQSQTQFAIQELEKVKDKIIKNSEEIVDTVDCIQDFHSYVTIGRLKRIIDDQIKKLRGIKD